MQKRAQAFFLLLMSVFLLGIFIHLIIPLQIIVNGTQKIEEVYNGYKIQVEQNTVRAIAYLNSLSISNQIQMYENIRSAVIRLFDTGDRYQDIDVSKITIHNAYLVANSNQTIYTPHSMWFITGITSISQMSEYEQWIYVMYAQIQKYLDSIEIHNKFHQGLQSIQITIDYDGQHVYFQYPSIAKEQFKNLNASIFTEEFYNTILNFRTQNRYQTTFQINNILKTCSPILDGTQPFAVVCLTLDIQTVTQKITSVLKVPNFQLSSSRYYLVRPIYQFEGLNFPQIISYFNSDDLNNVYVPQKQYFQQDLLDTKQLFSSKQNYLLNIQQLQKTKTYYVTPIETYNNIDTKQIIMYLVVVNDFAISELKNASHYKQIFVVMIVPSTILLIISALSMAFFMRPLFRKLHQYSSLMNEYCNLIRKNDLTLEITEVGQTSDFIQIFRKLKYLNLINKLSTPSYLKVSENERIIKLLRGLQLFDQLAYNKTNIYQNLAKCYYQVGELQNALKFLKLSVQRSVFQLGGIEGIQAIVKEQGDAKAQRKALIDKRQKQRPSMKQLRYKVFRLCSILYQIHKSGQKYILQELTKNVQTLKRLHYRSNISLEYVFCFIIETICSFDNYILYEQKQTLKKINLARQMIKKLENTSSKSNKIIPIQIVKSYLYYLKGKWLKRRQQYFQAYQNFILSLNGQYFDPTLHLKIKDEIMQILKIFQLQDHFPQKTFKYLTKKSDRSKQIRQFIFLSDVSNPRMNIQQFNSWKLKARKTAEYIMDNFIKEKDRIGISEFCNQLKVVCNLVQKNISQTMLKKELMSSIKARDQTIYSHLIPNLRRAIERTKNLKNQKIFLIFLKQGYEEDSQQIIQQIRNEYNSIFIFLVQQMSERIKNPSQQGFYVVQFEKYDDLNIILGDKSITKADNIIYLF